METNKRYNKIIKRITDIHTHYGSYAGHEFSPEEILEKVKKIGLKSIAIMPAPEKGNNDEIPDNHKVLHLIELAGEDIAIIPILLVSPGMVKADPDFLMVEDIPYKIIKIHPYAHDWAMYNSLFEKAVIHAQYKNVPVMIHTGYDESSPENHEWLYEKYPDVIFILAHAKPFDIAYKMMNKYSNVWIDLSFTDLEQLYVVQEIIDHNRILFGTDLPINEIFYKHTSEEYYYLRIKEIIDNFNVELLLKWGKYNVKKLFCFANPRS